MRRVMIGWKQGRQGWAGAFRATWGRVVEYPLGGVPATGGIVSSGGTIGAFSAEIRGGGEGSESVQALATLIAAQLSTLLAEPSLELPDKTLTA